MATTRNPTSRQLAAALAAALGLAGVQASASASVLPVTSCADDGTPGTLRQVAASAVQGDVIDLSGLSCTDSTITLTQGEVVLAASVTLNGPADRSLTLTTEGGRILTSLTTDTPAYLNVNNLTLSGGRVYTDGVFADGGCVLGNGAVNLTNSMVRDCAAHASNGFARGGAIYASTVQLTASQITGNSARATGSYQLARGGGVYARTLACADSSISNNAAHADTETTLGEGGGAMLSAGDLHLDRCTVSGNEAAVGGGIKQQAGYASVTVIANSTLSGNSASEAGAIEVFCSKCTPARLQVLNSTIAFNITGSTYSAAFSTNATVEAQSSIFASNTSLVGGFADLFASGMTGADNLAQSVNTTPDAGVITVTDDPQLLPLADNGGATSTHALAATSPALQKGNNAAQLATDQRGPGYSREASGTVDIGAWQTQDPVSAKAAADSVFHAAFD